MFEQPSATLVGGAAVVDGGVWLGLSTGGHASILRYDIASDQVSVISTSTAPPPNLSVLLVGGRGPQGVELYWFARDAASVPELVRWTERDHRLTPLNLAQAWRSPIPNCLGHTEVTVLRWLGPGRVEIQHESPVHYTLHDGQIDTRDPFRGLNTCRLRFAGVEASAEWAILETSSVESRPQLYHREEGAWIPGLRSAEWVPRALIQVEDELNISGDTGAVFRFRLIPSDGPLEIAKCPSIPTHATAVNFIEPLGRGCSWPAIPQTTRWPPAPSSAGWSSALAVGATDEIFGLLLLEVVPDGGRGPDVERADQVIEPEATRGDAERAPAGGEADVQWSLGALWLIKGSVGPIARDREAGDRDHRLHHGEGEEGAPPRLEVRAEGGGASDASQIEIRDADALLVDDPPVVHEEEVVATLDRELLLLRRGAGGGSVLSGRGIADRVDHVGPHGVGLKAHRLQRELQASTELGALGRQALQLRLSCARLLVHPKT